MNYRLAIALMLATLLCIGSARASDVTIGIDQPKVLAAGGFPDRSIVRNCLTNSEAQIGLECSSGRVLTCKISGKTTNGNGVRIECDGGCLVLNNTANNNAFGLMLSTSCSYGNNILVGNGFDPQDGISLGAGNTNLCRHDVRC